MPDTFSKRFVNTVLLPKLREQVHKWNPSDELESTNDNKLHKLNDWLLPWSDIVGKKNIRSFFDIIKPKLVSYFSTWKPSQFQGYELMAPWTPMLD